MIVDNVEKEWVIEFPDKSLLSAEEKSKAQAVMSDPKIQNCQTRDEVKQVIFKLCGVEYLTPSYVVRLVNK